MMIALIDVNTITTDTMKAREQSASQYEIVSEYMTKSEKLRG